MLRFFGYTDSLEIEEELWNDHNFNLETYQAVELKKACLNFLDSLYKLESRQGRFDRASIERVFTTCPGSVCPWNLEKILNLKGSNCLSLADWYALWYNYFNENALLAFRDLYYIGFIGKMKDAVNVLHWQSRDVHSQLHRRFFKTLILGNSPQKALIIESVLEIPGSRTAITPIDCRDSKNK